MTDDYWSPALIEQRAVAARAAEDRRMAKLVEQIDAFLTTVKPGPDDVYNAFWRMLNARPCPCGVARSEDCEAHADMHEHHTHWPRPARRAEVYDDRGDVAYDRWRDEQLEAM